MLQALVVSMNVVALAEIGDKTQLLSLVLAARYRQPLPIVAGVFVASAASNAVAGGLGTLLAHWLSPSIMNWVVVASFVLMAVWILIPDDLDESEVAAPTKGTGVFTATLLAFFLAELGDKTQVLAVALAAQYRDYGAVVAGTTLGMMLANVPVIYFGSRFAHRLHPKAVHLLACVVLLVLGTLALRHALSDTPPTG